MTTDTETKPDVISSVDSYSLKPAAIWARVSMKSQKEISPDTQISHCQQLLKSKGYVAIKIFSLDYCSLELFACKEFQELRKMLQNHEVEALAVYDRDRLEAIPIQRLTFVTELKQLGIELLICYGPPVVDGREGELVEFALAMGKERSVLRARTGARDGLHDRVTLKKNPKGRQSFAK